MTTGNDESGTALAESLTALRDLNGAGRYAECEDGARKLLQQVEATTGAESTAAAQVLELLVGCLWRGGKVGEAETLELANRGLELAEAKFGKDSLEAARGANNLAQVHLRRGDLASARPLWERVLAIREKLLGPEHADVAAVLNNLGILSEQAGDYQSAKAFAMRSVAIREKALGPEHPDVANSLNTLGTALGRVGDFEGERKTHERALAILEKALGPDHLRVATPLEALCKTEMDLYELAAARARCERAVAVRERTLGPDNPDVAATLDNLALVLVEMNDPAQAVEKLERALAIQEQAFGPEHHEVAYTLEILARARSRMGRPREAVELYRRALPIEEKSFGTEHPRLAEILTGLADAYVDLGDTAAAQPLFERALKITETTLGPEVLSAAEILVDLGGLQVRSGHLDAAERLYKRALAIREKYYGAGNPVVAEVLQRLVPIDRARGDVTSLLNHSLRAAEILRDHFRRMAQGLSEREALRYREGMDSSLDDALSTAASARARAPSMVAAILDELVRTRAMVLDEMGSRHHSVASGKSPGGGEIAEALRASRSRLARVIVKGPNPGQPEQYRQQLRETELAEERAERDIAAASAAFRLQRNQSQAGLREVRNALPPGFGMVAYVIYHSPVSPAPPATGADLAPARSSAYLAFVLHREGGISVVSLGDAKKIDSLVEDWRRELQPPPEGLYAADESGESRYRNVAGRLRQAVWDPVAPLLADSRQVFIVPDGALNLVSLETLPADSERYLVETAPRFHYLSAERDLIQASPRSPRRRGLLSLGGPDFDASPGGPPSVASAPVSNTPATRKGESQRGSVYRSPRPACGAFRSLRFDPLPGAAEEVSEIESLWSKTTQREGKPKEVSLVLTGAAASETAFKQEAPEHRVVHVATHGFFLPDRCGSTLEDSPLLLSGLAFAGANRRVESGSETEQEDGILTAQEIASLDLTGSEWLVLSGCDTGAGQAVSGEGILGMRRAFQVAGARTLIMSLWRVEDVATREWMRRLYEARGQGLSTAEAIRKANLESLRAYRARGRSTHPFYWGAFIAAGDWR